MKGVSGVLKTVTALIYLVPGIGFFKEYPFPVNISDTLLLVLCEVVAAMIIFLQFINKKATLELSKEEMQRITIRRAVLFAALFLATAFFSTTYTSRSNSGEDILLPIKCNEPLCTDYVKAKEARQTVAVYLGRTELEETIATSHRTEILASQVMYYILVVWLFNVLIMIFISLGIYCEKKIPQQAGDD